MACDDDLMANTFEAPLVQDCRCALADLPQFLKEPWAARGSVIQRWKHGEPASIHDGRWTWDQVALPRGAGEE